MFKFDNKTIHETIKYDVISNNNLDNYWVITTKDGIFAPPCGKMFHPSREAALKHWYNAMRWRAVQSYRREYAERSGLPYKHYWDIQCDISSGDIWKNFKQVMVEDYGFEIIQWKYAKRNVCS